MQEQVGQIQERKKEVKSVMIKDKLEQSESVKQRLLMRSSKKRNSSMNKLNL